jgi:hypothetical protein
LAAPLSATKKRVQTYSSGYLDNAMRASCLFLRTVGRPSLAFVLAGWLAGLGSDAQASDPAKHPEKAQPTVVAAKENQPVNSPFVHGQKPLSTRSHLHKKIRRVGRTTDSFSPTFIIDRTEMDRSGGATVGEVLRRYPIFF